KNPHAKNAKAARSKSFMDNWRLRPPCVSAFAKRLECVRFSAAFLPQSEELAVVHFEDVARRTRRARRKKLRFPGLSSRSSRSSRDIFWLLFENVPPPKEFLPLRLRGLCVRILLFRPADHLTRL